jgi:hypothetical protein
MCVCVCVCVCVYIYIYIYMKYILAIDHKNNLWCEFVTRTRHEKIYTYIHVLMDMDLYNVK